MSAQSPLFPNAHPFLELSRAQWARRDSAVRQRKRTCAFFAALLTIFAIAWQLAL